MVDCGPLVDTGENFETAFNSGGLLPVREPRTAGMGDENDHRMGNGNACLTFVAGVYFHPLYLPFLYQFPLFHFVVSSLKFSTCCFFKCNRLSITQLLTSIFSQLPWNGT